MQGKISLVFSYVKGDDKKVNEKETKIIAGLYPRVSTED